MGRHTGPRIAMLLALGCLAMAAAGARAAWPHDPFVNVALSTAASMQMDAAVATDGAGGAIVVWGEDSSLPQRICAQRVSAEGAILWGPTGVVISSFGPYSSGDVTNGAARPVVAPDGAGGVIVAWCGWTGWGWDTWRNYVITQRVTAAGATLWGSEGVVLCGVEGFKGHLTVLPDGAGGAVITWDDTRRNTGEYLTESDVYAGRVSGEGIAQWPAGGALVSSGTDLQFNPVATSDGAGGAIIAWIDQDAATYRSVVRAQCLAADGRRLWAVDGVLLCAPADNFDPAIVGDGDGGAIVAWSNEPVGGNRAVRAQHLVAGGVAAWSPGGVALGVAAGAQWGTAMAPDGAGGAIVAWQDFRGVDGDIYAQRVTPGGSLLWPAAGLPIATASGDQGPPRLAPDGAGGALATWTNLVGSPGYPEHILAQRLAPDGARLWSRGGAALCTAASPQYMGDIIGDGTGGAIVAWTDLHSGLGTTTFAQRIDPAGDTFRSEPVIAGVRDIAPDQGGRVRLRWAASNLDHPEAGMAIYSVWRQVPAKAAGAAAWEAIGTVLARGDAAYTFTATTTADSCTADAHTETFMVDYRLPAWGETWDSAPAGGRSVDNLAPASPANLRLAAGGRLAWDPAVEPDFRQYTVYGSGTPRLDGGAVVVARTTATGIDIGGLAYPYLLVTAGDIHDNESAAACRSALSGVEPARTAGLRLDGGAPNPFNPRTTIAFELPQAGHARLDVYDAAGLRVRRLVDADLAAGRHEAAWDGRTDAGVEAASGTYLVLLDTGNGALRRKMTLLR